MKYYLARENKGDCYSVFEIENDLIKSYYPHTKDSKSFNLLEELIASNDNSVHYVSLDQASQLEWMEFIPDNQDFICRTQRDAKLTESDWTQVADAPVDQAAWATYRQALRDIPSQAGFPNTINWPAEP